MLPNTAISDRPKVKSVSKKDSKNNRKVAAAAAAAAAAMSSIQSSPAVSTQMTAMRRSWRTKRSKLLFGHSFAKQNQQSNAIVAAPMQQESPTSPQHEQLLVQTVTRPCSQVIAPVATATPLQQTTTIEQQPNKQLNKQTNSASASDDDASNQFAPNETILQLVAQIPNHPLQKIAQKLIVDLPKSAANENYFKTNDDATSTTEATITSTTSK